MRALNLLDAWGAFCSEDGVNVGQGGGCDRRMSASCCREDSWGEGLRRREVLPRHSEGVP